MSISGWLLWPIRQRDSALVAGRAERVGGMAAAGDDSSPSYANRLEARGNWDWESGMRPIEWIGGEWCRRHSGLLLGWLALPVSCLDTGFCDPVLG